MDLCYFKVTHTSWLHTGILAGFFLLAFNSHARTEITPAIAVSQFLVNNKTATLDESGQVTRISPGIGVKYVQARLNLALDYQLNAIINSGLQSNDHENQSLNFLTQIAHLPKHWNTQINARIKQTNTSLDGIQVINDINDSSNSQELRTVGISTSYQNRLGKDVSYLAGLSLDYADLENQDDTDSIGLNLSINNNRTPNKLSWNVALKSRKSGSDGGGNQDDDQIDTIQAGLNYRINHQLSTFVVAEKSETDNENLNETNTLAGLFWAPSANSSVRIGAGVRDGETTWLLDSVIKSRRLKLSMNYEERVTTSRQIIIEESELLPDLVTTSQSLSIASVLLKKGTISLTAAGRRTEFTASYFNESRNRQDTDSEEERIEGLSLRTKRTLSRLSSVQLSISSRDSQTTQKNTINNIELNYNRKLSKHISWTAEIRNTEQTSDVPDNENEQALIGFSLSTIF